jgi:uncharacterized protein (TIGR03435 family)
MLRTLALAAVATLLAGQTPAEFEVASIRPSAEQPSGQIQAGLQITQAQVTIARLSLRDYLAMAFRLQTRQISGPDWLGSTRFDINAKLPDGATPEQIPDMLQALFADRFKLQAHREQRDTPVYALEVAKGGLKLEKIDPNRDVKEGTAFVVSGGGSAQGIGVDLGRGSSYAFADNRFEGKKLTMEALARTLTAFAGRPVVDTTGVEGYFDVSLPVTPEDYQGMLIRSAEAAGVSLPPQALRLIETSTLDSLFDSLRKVGLSLEAKRLPLDVLVVDHMEKAPTAN